MLPARALAEEYPYDVEKEVQDIWVIEDHDELDELLEVLDGLKKAKVPSGVDTETQDVDPKEESAAGKGSVVTLQIAWVDQAVYLDEQGVLELVKNKQAAINKAWIDCRDPSMMRKLKAWLEDPDAYKIFHNASFDKHAVANHGIYIKGVIGDTLGMSHLQYPERLSHSLDGAVGLVQTMLGEKRLTTLQALGVHKIGAKGQQIKQVEFRTMDKCVEDPEMRPYQQVYSCFDVQDTIQLFYLLKSLLLEMEWQEDERGLWGFWEDKLCPYNHVLWKMERTGVCIDEDVVDYLTVEYKKIQDSLTQEIYEMIGAPINLNSYQHKAWLLFTEDTRELPKGKKKSDGTFVLEGWGLPCKEIVEDNIDPWVKRPKKRGGGYTSGFPSTDNDHIQWTLEHTECEDAKKLLRLIGERQAITKLISGTLEPMARNLRDRHVTGVREPVDELLRYIHGTFSVKARTGRLACAKPNLQQIPSRSKLGKAIRHAFVCEVGEAMLVADYSQLELNILGCYLMLLFGDDEYCQLLRSGDIHQATADKLGITRSMAKVVNFGILYGMSKYKLANDLRISLAEAEKILKDYMRAYPGVKKYVEWAIAYAKQHGTARTLAGRYRQLDNINEVFRGGRAAGRPTGLARADERRAGNTPIQGSAQDIVCAAQLALDADEELQSYGFQMRLAVHDEIVATCKAEFREKAVKRMCYLMENAYTFPEFEGLVKFPVEGFCGSTWGESKDGGLFECPTCDDESSTIVVGKCPDCGGEGAVSVDVAEELSWQARKEAA